MPLCSHGECCIQCKGSSLPQGAYSLDTDSRGVGVGVGQREEQGCLHPEGALSSTQLCLAHLESRKCLTASVMGGLAPAGEGAAQGSSRRTEEGAVGFPSKVSL